MINPFQPDAPEDRDIGFRYNRYRRYLQRRQRRAKRHNRTLFIMVPVMAAALLISLYHTFTPKRSMSEEAQKTADMLPSGFLENLDNASARLDSLLQTFLPDDTLASRRMLDMFDSLDPKFDIFLNPELGSILNRFSRSDRPNSDDGEQAAPKSDR